jgi:AraC-like DNA-binding protein
VAPELLLAGMPVKVVATSLGFKQAAHFCRHFKRLHQRTPTEFVVLHRPAAAKVAFR